MKNKLFKTTVGLLSVVLLSITPVHAGSDFSDVDTDLWYYDSVNWAEDKGLMRGYTDKIFAPNDRLTRAQAVAIIHRMHSPSSEVKYKDTFLDVKKSDWYAKSVIWANDVHIAYGYGDEFGAADQVTREQFVTMLYRYSEYLAHIVDSKNLDIEHFPDSHKVSPYAKIPMEWAYGYGLINGKADGILNPLGYTTRAECAAIIRRYVEQYIIEV